MALSTEFATPNPSFDPSKYGRKSAARTANISKNALKPNVDPPSTVPLFQRSVVTVPEANKAFPSAFREATTEATTLVPQSTCPVEAGLPHSAVKITINEEAKPAIIFAVESERRASFQALEEDCARPRGEEAKDTTDSEVQKEKHTFTPNHEVVPIKSGSEDIQPYPTTLITAESIDIASIPAPADAESTDTRRLMSIRHIRNIRQAKIENRWITVARVDEWTCTVPRHAFKEGELVVYIEIDAFLPSTDRRFGMMSSLQTFNGELGHRVKTRRFGAYPDKLVVQGYIYPLEKFDEIFQEIKCIRQVLCNDSSDKSSPNMIEEVICAMYRNEDWAAKIGVKKWEEPKPVNKPNKHPKLGGVPNRVFRKTDITHFEDCPNLFTKGKYFAREYQESIKMDGASMSVYFVKKTARNYSDLNDLPDQVGPNTVLENGRFGVTSKSVDLNELSNCGFGYWKTAINNELPAKLSKMDRSIAIQGEICGPGINQNREKLEETQFFVYSMWDIAAQKYIDPRKVESLAKKLGLKHVPVLDYIKIRDIASSHSDLRERADKRTGEGLVYKCVRDGRSFKVHSPAYKVLHNC